MDPEFWSQRWVIALVCLIIGFALGVYVGGRN
jgi:hypothetical protein